MLLWHRTLLENLRAAGYEPEQIDKIYPGMVDLTELFDFPTIAELSRHLEGKLAATV